MKGNAGILLLGLLAVLLLSSESTTALASTPAGTPAGTPASTNYTPSTKSSEGDLNSVNNNTPAGVQPGAPTVLAPTQAQLILQNYNPNAPGAFTPSQAMSAAAYYAANPADLSPINPVTGLHTINYVVNISGQQA